MKIGILIAGHLAESMFATHGDIDQVMENMLKGQGFSIDNYAVCDGEFPGDVTSAQGWIISGSVHCANDDIDWIHQLKAFIKKAYQRSIPLIGICFGHQIIASALGGRVEPFAGGWAMGGHQYTLHDGSVSPKVIAWHQDQVVQKPADASCIGSSGFCENAFLVYGDKVFTMQPHPEFSVELGRDLLAIKQSAFDSQWVESVAQSLDEPLDSVIFHRAIGHFLKTGKVLITVD
ncbi:MAG: type 1 glutamine amidotransferase [Oceanospirillaceae bacterium]